MTKRCEPHLGWLKDGVGILKAPMSTTEPRSVVYYDPARHALGDAVVGCASAFVLSQAIGADFRILPGQLNLGSYFDIPAEHLVQEPLHNIPCMVYLHDPAQDRALAETDLRLYGIPIGDHSGSPTLARRPALIVRSCMNFGRFIYRNPHHIAHLPIPEPEVIHHLFEHILLPRPTHLQRFEQLRKELRMEDAICVHVRCDDVWGDSNTGEGRFAVDDTIRRFARCVKSVAKPGSPVILLSDHVDRVLKVFLEESVVCLTIPGEASHSSKSFAPNHEKTLIDLLTIGACRTAIVSYWSNFSRVGVLRTRTKPWIVQASMMRRAGIPFEFNVCMGEGVEFRQAELSELLSKEP